MSRSKDIGTRAETAVVRAIRPWFPHAERRALHGVLDLGDITGTPGIVWEVKGGEAARKPSDSQVQEWMEETDAERYNADADVGVLVLQRSGFGQERAACWWSVVPVDVVAPLQTGLVLADGPNLPMVPAWMRLGDVCELLVAAGYGTRPEVIA